MRLLELQRYYSWIIDRFHLSTQAFQWATHAKRYDFRWLEERLGPLGFRLIYCRRAPETFASARAERLKVSANPAQYADLNRFIQEQALLDQLVAQSSLPRYELDISDNELPAAVERVVAWLKASGALYYPESK